MHENFEDVEVDEMFDEFKKRHSKSYQDPAEHEQRKHIFRHNMRQGESAPVIIMILCMENRLIACLFSPRREVYKFVGR